MSYAEIYELARAEMNAEVETNAVAALKQYAAAGLTLPKPHFQYWGLSPEELGRLTTDADVLGQLTGADTYDGRYNPDDDVKYDNDRLIGLTFGWGKGSDYPEADWFKAQIESWRNVLPIGSHVIIDAEIDAPTVDVPIWHEIAGMVEDAFDRPPIWYGKGCRRTHAGQMNDYARSVPKAVAGYDSYTLYRPQELQDCIRMANENPQARYAFLSLGAGHEWTGSSEWTFNFDIDYPTQNDRNLGAWINDKWYGRPGSRYEVQALNDLDGVIMYPRLFDPRRSSPFSRFLAYFEGANRINVEGDE